MSGNFLHLARHMTLTAAIALAGQSLAAPAFAVDVKESATYMEQAKRFLSQGQLRAARIELLNAVKANPDNLEARLELANLYLRTGQGIAAQAEIEAARQAGATRDGTRVKLGEAFVLQGLYDEALKEIDLDEIPATDVSQAYRIRGRALAGRGDHEEAEAAFLKAEELDESAPEVKVDLARALFRTGRLAEAFTKIDAALALDPNNVSALLFKGETTRLTQNLETALPFFERVLELEPDNYTARLERAATLLDLGREDEARRDIDDVYQVYPEHPLAHYLSAVLRARSGDFEGARELMNRTRGVLDNYIPAIQFKGLVAYELGELEQATQHLLRVLRALPNNNAARRVYGAALLRKGEPKLAVEALQPLIDQGLNDTPLLTLMGMAYGRSGNYEQAMTYFENAVAQSPDQSTLRTQLAVSRLAVGDPAAAERDLEGLLELEPDSTNALIMLGLIELREKRYDEALESARKIIDLKPDLALAHNMLGAGFLGKGQLDDARVAFTTAVEKDPDYEEARRNLAQLDIADKRYDDARRHYLRVLESDRQDVKTLRALANLADLENKPDEALAWTERAAAADPTLLNPRVQFIDRLLKDNQLDRALNEATKLTNDFPGQTLPFEVLGRVQIAAGNPDRAVTAFREYVKIAPDNVAGYRLLAGAYVENEDFDAARATLRQALDLREQLEEVLFGLIQIEVHEKQYERALRYAERLREEFPDRALGVVTMGDLYMGMRDFSRAVRAYNEAIEQNKTQAIVLKLAGAYTANGDPAQGEAVMRGWLEQNPIDQTVHLALGSHLLRIGDLERAKTEHENIVGRFGESALVLNNLAWIYQQLDDPKMEATAERAYELDPQSPQILDTLGWILVSEGLDPKRGVVLLEQAAQRQPDDGNIRYHLAYALNANGRSAAAERELRALLDRDLQFSSRPQAKNLLDQLQGGPAN
ncbi:MAG: PEP-CTERM system TPR-repeat protein PrsT [Sphingomonadales bacterium]|jgi:putative PEP-CTERM system TPR-repeat lipoprotein